jgi:hypothetical protein
VKKSKIPIKIIMACLKREEFFNGEKIRGDLVEWHTGKVTLEIISSLICPGKIPGTLDIRRPIFLGKTPKIIGTKLRMIYGQAVIFQIGRAHV